MSDTLIRIRRAVLAGHYDFSLRAISEMEAYYFLISAKHAE